jgi:hypothetical protein
LRPPSRRYRGAPASPRSDFSGQRARKARPQNRAVYPIAAGGPVVSNSALKLVRAGKEQRVKATRLEIGLVIGYIELHRRLLGKAFGFGRVLASTPGEASPNGEASTFWSLADRARSGKITLLWPDTLTTMSTLSSFAL